MNTYPKPSWVLGEVTRAFSQVMVTDAEGEAHVAEASTMGFLPGQWPEKITVIDAVNDLHLAFVYAEVDLAHGEIASVTYSGPGERELIVLND